MNKVYIYNSDFVSLINLVGYLIKNNIKPYNIKNDDYFPNLFEETIKLNVNVNNNFIQNIIKLFGDYVFKILYNVFLSNEKNKELIIYYFCLNAKKYQKNIVYRRDLKCVCKALTISNYVSHETHKYKGFLRFLELDNKVLYAEIEPVNDILFFLSCHFAKRLKNDYWVIKDVRRNIFSVFNKKDFAILSSDEFEINTDRISENEEFIQNLWKNFYETVGIKERKNDKRRINLMPKRYWKYIIEVSDK